MKRTAKLSRRIAVWLGLAYLGLVPPGRQSFAPPTLRATLGEGRQSSLYFLAFSPDGRTLISGTPEDGDIRLWDVATGKNTATLSGLMGEAGCAAFSPDGETLASGVMVKGGSTAIKLWDMNTRQQKATLPGVGVRSVAFSPDGSVLAVGSLDGKVRLWDVTDGKNTTTLEAPEVDALAFSPDGKRLAASMDRTVKLWDLASGKNEAAFTWEFGPWGDCSSVAFSPDGKDLAGGGQTDGMGIGGGSGCVAMWDLTGRKEKTYLHAPHSTYVKCVAFSPDGKLLVGGSEVGLVQLWSASTGKPLATLRASYLDVRSVAFSPDGRILAAGIADGHIKLWDVPKATRP